MTYEELHKAYSDAKNQILILQQQVEWLKKQLFGQKSEKLKHPELFALEAPAEPEPPATEEAKPVEIDLPPKDKTPRKIRKDRLPENLPVVLVEIIPDIVKEDPEKWREAGFEEKIQLEKEPAYFYLHKTRRLKYVPVDEPFTAPIIVPAKPTMIDCGFWGPGLISEILINKYLYHIPFDRQQVLNLQRYGIDLSPKTMGDAAAKVGEQVELLIKLMKKQMLDEGYVRADETFIRYLDRKQPGGSSQGYFWVYRGMHGDVIFDWQTSREHRHVAEWLGSDYEGVLQADAYQAYANYCRKQQEAGKKVKLAACMAHIRRKFVEARKERPEIVNRILKIICQLYQIEKDLREAKADAQTRYQVRQDDARSKIELLGVEFKKLIVTEIRPQSRLGRALQYAVGQWPQMSTYLEDGRVEIDNNATENDIRPSAVGKKNWLFMGSPDAGKRGAAIYTLILSARNHGVNPQAYLKDVIERLPQMKNDDPALKELLPGEWAKAHRETHPAVKSQRAKKIA